MPYLDSDARTAQSDRMIATTSRPVRAAHPVLRTLLSGPYPAVMGVLNVTPDSFSDGGQFIAPERAPDAVPVFDQDALPAMQRPG